MCYTTTTLQIEIRGIPADENAQKTKTVDNNGFNPVWDDTLQFTVTCPQLALVFFRVWDNDRFAGDFTVAEYSVPMRCMQTGYRMIGLRDRHGHTIGPTSLFVHISIDKSAD